MNKLLLALALAPAMLGAQEVSSSFLWDVKAKTVVPVVSTPFGSFKDVLGIKGFNLDVIMFAGVRAQVRRVPVFTGGVGLIYSMPLASNLSAHIGMAGRLEAGSPIVPVGALFGFSWKL